MVFVWIMAALVLLWLLAVGLDFILERFPGKTNSITDDFSQQQDELYRQTKMYELEKWWDREHLSTSDFYDKYKESRHLKPIATGNTHTHVAQSQLEIWDKFPTMESWERADDQMRKQFEKEFKKTAKRPALILSDETIAFVPKNEHDFVQTMVTGTSCDCDACTGKTTYLDALNYQKP